MDGASYHVTARVNRKELALDDSNVKEMFLSVICRAKKRFGFTLKQLVIMGNHYHMIIKPGKSNGLSEIMKWIQQTMAIIYNRVNGLTGHFWGDRFFSLIIPDMAAFLRIYFYIQENPVRAGLVEMSRYWGWGSEALKLRLSWLFDDPPEDI